MQQLKKQRPEECVKLDAPPGWQPPPRKRHIVPLLEEPEEAAMAPAAERPDLEHVVWSVQQLFERQLGPGRGLPDALKASSTAEGAASRDRQKLAFKVASGRALDYQAVPARGALVGLTHHPAKRAPHRKPAAPPPPQPAHATLWALVQPSEGLGINTALHAVDAGRTGFGGWHQAGFLDLSSRVGLEYALSRHPASGVSGELELVATTPKLPLLPPVTARHRVAGAVAASKLQHSSTLSAPLLGGIALARAELSELVPGSSQQPGEGAVLRLELLGRSKRSRGLAGGVQVQPALVSSFGRGNGGSGSGSKSGSDSDDEEASSSSKACGSGSPDQQPRRLPGLRLEMAPHALRGWDGVSGRWQQAWGSRLCSTVAYQARQRRWNLDLSHKLNGWLTAAGSMACDMREAAAAPGPASGSEEIEAAEGGGVADRLRQLSAHLRGYAAGASVCRAKLRLTCKLRQPARQLRLESSYGAGEEGATHSLAYRCGRRPDHAQQHGWWDMGVEARPAARHVYLRLDFFAPL